jgi:tripartite-type tricarboxylate transporter receptor subunit TctC
MHTFTSEMQRGGRQAAYVLGVALAMCCTQVHAQAWPEKAIRLVVPSPPGGGTDTLSRLLASKLGEMQKWQIVVDNRAGAGGNVGLDLVAKSAPDGYTIVMGESSNLTINPYLYKALPFDPAKDVAAVALVGTVPLVLVVAASSPYDSLASLVEAARKKELVFASSGNGTVGHLVGETWQRAIGVKMLHVPYKGAGPVMTDLLGGQVDLHFASLPAALPLVKAGKLRALAVTASKRLPQLPEVPTLAESGLPNFEYQVIYGVVAPAGTPAPIVVRLNAEINRALATSELRASLAERGVDYRPTTPEEFGTFLENERSKWSRAVKDSGATVD